PEPSPEGQTAVGTLGLRATIAPGDSAELPFLLAWHFPNLTNTWNREEGCGGARLGNYYTREFPDAWSLGCDSLAKIDELERRSATFREALYGSTLPAPVLDAAGSQMSIIRTTTCLRTADGRFHAFEIGRASCRVRVVSLVWA